MKGKLLIAIGAVVTCAGFLDVAWDARQSLRRAETEGLNLESERARLVKAIAETASRLEQISAEFGRARAEHEQLLNQAKKPPQRPPTMALDAKAAAGMAAVASIDWWNVILETRPEMQAQFLVSFRMGLSASYGGLWQALGLSPAQIEHFSNVMVAAAERGLDLRSAMRSQGLTEADPGIAALRQQANDQTRQAQFEALGEDGYRQLQEYELSLSSRTMVQGLAGSLALTNTPLSDGQAEQLVKILAGAGQPARPLAPSDALGLLSGERGGPYDAYITELESARRGQHPARQVTDVTTALAQAQEILSQPQFAGFEAEILRRQDVIALFNEIRQMPDPTIGFTFGRR